MKMYGKKAASIAMAVVMTASMTTPQTLNFLNAVPSAIVASAADDTTFKEKVTVDVLNRDFRDITKNGKFYVSKKLISGLVLDMLPAPTGLYTDWTVTVYQISGSEENVIGKSSGTAKELVGYAPIQEIVTDITVDYQDACTYIFTIVANETNNSVGYTELKWNRYEGWSLCQMIDMGTGATNQRVPQTIVKGGDTLLGKVLEKANITSLKGSDGSTCTIEGTGGTFKTGTAATTVGVISSGISFSNVISGMPAQARTAAGYVYTIVPEISGEFLMNNKPILTKGKLTISKNAMSGTGNGKWYVNYCMIDDTVAGEYERTVSNAVFYESAISEVVVFRNGEKIDTLTGAEFTTLNWKTVKTIEPENADDVYTMTIGFKDTSRTARFYQLNTDTGLWNLVDNSKGGAAAASPETAGMIAENKITTNVDDESEYIVHINRDTFPDEAADCYYFEGDKTVPKQSWTLEEFLAGEETVDLGSLTSDPVKGVVFDYHKAGTAVYQFEGLTPVLVETTGLRAEGTFPNDILQQALVNTGDDLLIVGTDVYGDPVERHVHADGNVTDVPTGDVKEGYIYDEDTGFFDTIKDGHSGMNTNGDGTFVLNKDTGANSAVGSNGKAGDVIAITATDKDGKDASSELTLTADNQPIPVGSAKNGIVADKTTGLFDEMVNGKPDDGDIFNLTNADGTNALVPSNGKKGDTVVIDGTDKDGNPVHREITLTEDGQAIPTGDVVNGTVTDKTTGLVDTIKDGKPDSGSSFNLTDNDGTNATTPTNGKKGDTVAIDGTDKDGNPVHREITLTEDGQALPTGDVANGTITDKTTGIFDEIVDGKPDDGKSYNLTDSDGTNATVASNGKKGDTVVIDGTDKDGNPVHREITLTEDGQALPTGDVKDGTVTDKTTGLFDEIVDGKPDSGKQFNLTDSDGTNATVASNGKKGDEVVIDGTDKDGKPVHREITLTEDGQALPTGDVANGTVTDKTTGIFDEIVDGKPDSGKQFNLTTSDGTNTVIPSNGKKGDTVIIEGTDKDGNAVKRELTLTEDGQALPAGDVESGTVSDTTTGIFDEVVGGKPDSGKQFNLTDAETFNPLYTLKDTAGNVLKEGEVASGNAVDKIADMKTDLGMTAAEITAAQKSAPTGVLVLEEGAARTNKIADAAKASSPETAAVQLEIKSNKATGKVTVFKMTGVTGDINQDGKFNVQDAVYANKYLHGKQSLKPSNLAAGDVTGDGVVNIFDMIRLKQLLLKK